MRSKNKWFKVTIDKIKYPIKYVIRMEPPNPVYNHRIIGTARKIHNKMQKKKIIKTYEGIHGTLVCELGVLPQESN